MLHKSFIIKVNRAINASHLSILPATQKFSLYTTIHKAIRKELFETCILAGMTDFSNCQSSIIFQEKFDSLLKLLRKHSINEDTFIHPLLAEKGLSEYDLLKNDHENLEEQLYQLEQALNQIFDSKNRTAILEHSNQFYLLFSQFISHYLDHLLIEETKIMDTLNANYTLSELIQVMDTFKKSQASHETMHSLHLMFSAIHPIEVANILANIQKSGSNLSVD